MSHANRLLVVSDNPELSLFLKDLLAQLPRRLERVDFCYTSYNQAPDKMMALGAMQINVKDGATIARVIRDYDLVFSLHCKQIFPAPLVEQVRCVNFHPGLNPYNRGWFPQAFSIVNGLPVGATVHLMDREVDHGAILAQRQVEIGVADTSYEVYRKVIETEKDLMREHMAGILDASITPSHAGTEGNYNSIGDYRALCQLNLEHSGTLREHLNLLRATSHQGFRNAWFADETGKRYYVSIRIEPDQ